MQDFVRATQPVLNRFVEKRKEEEAKKAINIVSYVASFLMLIGLSVGLVLGWIFWG